VCYSICNSITIRVLIYIFLKFVISIIFLNCAVCNFSNTFKKQEDEMFAKIRIEKYTLTLTLIRDHLIFFHDSYYMKKIPQNFGRYFRKKCLLLVFNIPSVYLPYI